MRVYQGEAGTLGPQTLALAPLTWLSVLGLIMAFPETVPMLPDYQKKMAE